MKTFVDLCINLSLLIAFTSIFGFLRRRLHPRSKTISQALDGIAFAGIAVVGMLTPIELMPGVIMDGRVIVTALSAIFSGPLAALMTAAGASVYRYAIGGLGAYPGIAAILLGAVTGVVFARLTRRKLVDLSMRSFMMLGSVNAVIGLVCTLFVPDWEIAYAAFLKYLIPVNVFYPVTALLIGFLLVRALKNIDTEQELRKWALAFEHAGWGMAIGRGEAFEAMNASYARMHGYRVEELVGRPVADVLTPAGRAEMGDHIEKVEGKGHQSIEVDHVRQDGSVFPAHVEVTGVETDAGVPYRVVNLQDVTERKSFERQLKIKSDAIEHSINGYCVVGPDGNLNYINKAFLEMWGYPSPGEIIGSSPSRYFSDSTVFESIHATLEKGDSRRADLTAVRRDGTPFEVSMVFYRYTDEFGDSVLAASSVDITEQKKLREQLRQAEKLQAVGQLAGGIAHDFNNQLGGILGYADMIRTRTEDETIRRYANNVVVGSKRAADLTHQLLSFARKGQRRVARVDIRQLILEVDAIVRRSVDRKISIECDFSPVDLIVDGDPSQLQNAILNLAINARDAMPDGGHLVIATSIVDIDRDLAGLQSIALGEYAEISVSDTGTGIPLDVQSHMFEPFFTTKEDGRGTGMGLAAVYGTVLEHSGSVTVESEPGAGATFRVLLPLSSDPDVAGAAATRENNHPIANYTVLVVDDEPDLRDMLSSMLQDEDHRVIACSNGVEALETYRESGQSIDLVILDMVMPEMGGYEAYLEMRKINPDVKVLLSSGYAINDETQRILDAGVRGLLQKPYRKADLLDMMWSIMESGS